MSNSLNFDTPAQFLTHCSQVDESKRQSLVSDLYSVMLSQRAQLDDISSKLSSMQHENFQYSAVNQELRRELSLAHKNIADILQKFAVDQFRLSEIEKSQTERENVVDPEHSARGQQRSELFKIEEKFTGEDKSLYSSFQWQVRIALSQNSDRFVTLQPQISLIYQHLGSGPKSFLDRYLTRDGQFDFASLEGVWDVLDVSYRIPNEEEEARKSLSYIRQGNLAFGNFLSEFQRLHNLSGIMDDKTLISYMRNAVSKEMRSCIGQHQDIHKTYTFDEYITLCKECVTRLDLERPSKHNIRYLAQKSHIAAAHSSGSGANAVPLGGDPMIIDRAELSHIGPDGKLTCEERQRRYKLKLCMRCGKPGHRAHNCNLQRKDKAISRIEIEGDGLSTSSEELKE